MEAARSLWSLGHSNRKTIPAGASGQLCTLVVELKDQCWVIFDVLNRSFELAGDR